MTSQARRERRRGASSFGRRCHWSLGQFTEYFQRHGAGGEPRISEPARGSALHAVGYRFVRLVGSGARHHEGVAGGRGRPRGASHQPLGTRALAQGSRHDARFRRARTRNRPRPYRAARGEGGQRSPPIAVLRWAVQSLRGSGRITIDKPVHRAGREGPGAGRIRPGAWRGILDRASTRLRGATLFDFRGRGNGRFGG